MVANGIPMSYLDSGSSGMPSSLLRSRQILAREDQRDGPPAWLAEEDAGFLGSSFSAGGVPYVSPSRNLRENSSGISDDEGDLKTRFAHSMTRLLGGGLGESGGRGYGRGYRVDPDVHPPPRQVPLDGYTPTRERRSTSPERRMQHRSSRSSRGDSPSPSRDDPPDEPRDTTTPSRSRQGLAHEYHRVGSHRVRGTAVTGGAGAGEVGGSSSGRPGVEEEEEERACRDQFQRAKATPDYYPYHYGNSEYYACGGNEYFIWQY